MSGTRDAISLLSDPEPFEAVVDGTGSGPLAVVGDPYAGREQVLGDDPDVPADGGPVVVDDCQHLYTRVVGGFDHLEAVLDLLARTERTVVTGWNRCAWAYLTTVRTDETVFADGVELGTVAPDRLAELVLARYGSVPSFERDEAERTGPVSVRRYTVDIGGRTLSVPVPVPDLSGTTGADRDRAMTIVEEALVTSRYVYVDDDHPAAVRVEDDTYHRTIRGKAYVGDLRDEFAFTSDVTRRAPEAFDRHGIETPEVPARFGSG